MEAASGMMAATHSTHAGDRGMGRQVATKLTYVQEFPADPVAVMAMLRDPSYVQEKGERTGSYDISVDVTQAADGGVTISCTRSMPAEVPSYAAPFVGDTITITETQTWAAPASDGSTRADVTVEFNSPLAYSGTITLSPGAAGSVALNEGSFRASVPFIGGKVEKVEGAPEGQRNQLLFQAAANLGEFVGAGLLRGEMVEASLTLAAEACGLTHDDGGFAVEATIASGMRRGIANPRDVTS